MQYVVAGVIGYLRLGTHLGDRGTPPRRRSVHHRRRQSGRLERAEQLGGRRAVPAFAGDGLKGLLVKVAGWTLGGFWGAWAGVAGAMAGHALPLFAGFRGGKSVMAFVGGAIVLSPPAALLAAVACVVVTGATSFAWGARAAVFGFPVFQLAFDPVERVIATGMLMAFIGLLFAIDRLRSL